jgi:hypothetical protein
MGTIGDTGGSLQHERDALASLLLQVMSVCQCALQAQQDACEQANLMASVMKNAVKSSERIQVWELFFQQSPVCVGHVHKSRAHILSVCFAEDDPTGLQQPHQDISEVNHMHFHGADCQLCTEECKFSLWSCCLQYIRFTTGPAHCAAHVPQNQLRVQSMCLIT